LNEINVHHQGWRVTALLFSKKTMQGKVDFGIAKKTVWTL